MFRRKKKNPTQSDNIDEEQAKEIAEAATILAALLAKASLAEEEKQIWLNLIPVMSNEQLLELQEILITEQLGQIQYQELLKLKEKIMDINEEYDKKILASQKEALTELDKLEKEIDQLPEK